MKQLAFVIELDRCIGCKACQVSCKMENNTTLGSDRTKVRTVGPIGIHPNLEMYFLPTACQQCEKPVCVEVCPSGAIYKRREDGVVAIDPKKCIGCHICNEECPYHANTFSEMRRVMDKCNLCAESRAEGEQPACIRNCSGRALHYGDINDPNSEVSKLLKEAGEENVYSLKDFGNKPSTRYILKTATWQDVLPLALDEASMMKGDRSWES